MLDAGWVDFFITTAEAAEIAIAKADPKLKPLGKSFGTSENYLLIAKKHPQSPELIAAFSKGLEALKTKGLEALKTKGMWRKIIAQHKL